MLSTQGDFVQIYVWNREKNTIRRISQRGMDAGQTEITSPDDDVGPMVWQDEKHIIAGLLPAGEAGTVLDRDRGVERFALAQWEKAKSGYETTSNEIGSPLEVVSRKESIAIIDVSRVTVQEIGAVPSVGRRWIRIAPGWQHGAVLTQMNAEPLHAGHPPVPGYQTQVGVYGLLNP
jgi:hypothetical protein